MISLNKIVTDAAERLRLECYEIAFESLFIKAYVDSLTPNVNCSSKDVANECTNYARRAIRNAGGISVLTNAVQHETDPFKKEFLNDFVNECVNIGNTMSDKILAKQVMKSAIESDANIDMDDPDIGDDDEDSDDISDEPVEPTLPSTFANKDITQMQLDTKISDSDIENLKKAASKLDLDSISKVVSDKVADVIQAEKVTRFKMDEEKERLKQALMNVDTNDITDENVAESAMESLLHVPLSKYEVTAHRTFYSTLQRKAMESILSLKKDANVDAADTLMDITTNYTTKAFTPVELSFKEAATRVIEMTVANECLDQTAMQDTVSKATILATVIYTLIELMHTTSLYKCTPKEVKDICTKECDISKVNDVANTVNKNVTAAVEMNKKAMSKMVDIEDVQDLGASYAELKTKLQNAKESCGIPISDAVFTELDNLITYGENRVIDIQNSYKKASESLTTYDSLSRIREDDIHRLNSIAGAIKYKTFDNIKFRCKEATESCAVFSVEACIGKTPIYASQLNLVGLENVEPEKYVQYILEKSRIKEITPRGEQPDYCAIVNGHTYSLR